VTSREGVNNTQSVQFNGVDSSISLPDINQNIDTVTMWFYSDKAVDPSVTGNVILSPEG